MYSVDIDLIPRANADACPAQLHYTAGIGSCNCEDHCSWDLCRLVVAPRDCLMGTYSEWQWDYLKVAWVAQVVQGNST